MTYFCFLDAADATSAYMQPLEAKTDATAVVEARALLDEHRTQGHARVYQGDLLIAAFPRGEG